jgi:hypothetical protein
MRVMCLFGSNIRIIAFNCSLSRIRQKNNPKYAKTFFISIAYICVLITLKRLCGEKKFSSGHTKLIYWPSNCIYFFDFVTNSLSAQRFISKNLHTMKKSNSIPFNGRNNNNRNESLKKVSFIWYVPCEEHTKYI